MAKPLTPPLVTPMIDPKTGMVTIPWALFFEQVAKQVNEMYPLVFP